MVEDRYRNILYLPREKVYLAIRNTTAAIAIKKVMQKICLKVKLKGPRIIEQC